MIRTRPSTTTSTTTRRPPLATACRICLALVLPALLLAGCGGEKQAKTVPTSSGIFVNGEPAEGALVALHPVTGDFDQRGTRPTARAKADGSLVFTTFEKGDGVPPGEYRVSIVWEKNPGSFQPSADRLLGKYADPNKSKLRVVVKEGEAQITPIRLEDVKLADDKAKPATKKKPSTDERLF